VSANTKTRRSEGATAASNAAMAASHARSSPKGTQADAIEAQVQHGVLTVTIPKAPAATVRKVEVKGGGLIDKAKKIFSKPAEAPNAAPQA
jgi:HSP20 family molecular chaperone IbpA